MQSAAESCSDAGSCLVAASDALKEAKRELPNFLGVKRLLAGSPEHEGAASILEETVHQLGSHLGRVEAAVQAATSLVAMLLPRDETERGGGAGRRASASSSASGVEHTLHAMRSRTAAASERVVGTPPSEEASGEASSYREIIATNVIDRTFDEYKRRLRQKLVEAEAELERYRSGKAILEANAEIDRLKREQRQRDKDHEAEKSKWLGMLTSSSRLFDSAAASSSTKVASAAPSSGPSPAQVAEMRIRFDASLAHLQHLGFLREAQLEMKGLLAMQHVTKIGLINSGGPGSARSSRGPSPTSTPTQRTLDAREVRPRRQPQPPPAAERAVDVEERQMMMMKVDPRKGGSSISQKPLHARRAPT